MSTTRLALVALAVASACAVALAHATPPASNGKIAFQRYLFQDHPLQADIFVANADGTVERRITRAREGSSTANPTGHATASASSSSAVPRWTGHARSGPSTATEPA
jgi:hypothetical protein